jgi:DNA-directed RNA polymerase specialized sigma subunit
MSSDNVTPDESYNFYLSRIRPKRLPPKEEKILFQQAWAHQEEIVDALLTLMYPLVQYLRLEMRVAKLNRSGYIPKDVRPQNRNSQMRSLEREAWVELMQSIINHFLDGNHEEVGKRKEELRDLLLSDRDLNTYREICGFLTPKNTEWVPGPEVDSAIARIEENFRGYYKIEETLLSHVFAFARSQARQAELRGNPLDDYQQCALVGSITAIRKYDPRRGLKFSTSAINWIKGRVWRYRNEVEPMLHRDAEFKRLQKDVRAILEGRQITMGEAIEDENIQRMVARELQASFSDIRSFFVAYTTPDSMNTGPDQRPFEEWATPYDESGAMLGGVDTSTTDPAEFADISALEDRIISQMTKFEPENHYLIAMTLGIGTAQSSMRLIDSVFQKAVERIENTEIVPPGKRRGVLIPQIFSDTLEEDQIQ